MEIIGSEEFECNGFTFVSGFDSSNLAGVESVPNEECVANGLHLRLKSSPREEAPDFEFNVWSRRDCQGTDYENTFKSWFFFGVKTRSAPGTLVQLNIMGVQPKMYAEGMSPAYLVIPGSQEWQRVKHKISFIFCDDKYGISFKFRMPPTVRATTYFAFTYPFPFEQLQSYLSVAGKFLRHKEIYFQRECVCYTLEGRHVELITVSSYKNITKLREPRLKNLFPLKDCPRAFAFRNKKVVFLSARVHPGETPSSFVLKGFMDYILTSFDPVAVNLRNNFVFKIIPMLNPDGVAKGHFRTDSRGTDLNRVYQEPSFYHHPSIYAARTLILYYHFGKEVEYVPNIPDEAKKHGTELELLSPAILSDTVIQEENKDPESVHKTRSKMSISSGNKFGTVQQKIQQSVNSSLYCPSPRNYLKGNVRKKGTADDTLRVSNSCSENCQVTSYGSSLGNQNKRLGSQSTTKIADKTPEEVLPAPKESGLFMYVDMHGHSSKKGVFMYGNYFKDPDDLVECMLFPKIMSLNSENFDFTACGFSERNMSLKDKSGELGKEGCGRVMAMKLTGNVRCYTLECNYNTGRTVNELPPRAVVDSKSDVAQRKMPPLPLPYTPQTFEDVGKALAVSLLDLRACNPWSRIPYSEYRSLNGIRKWLKMQCLPEQEHINKRHSKPRKSLNRNH